MFSYPNSIHVHICEGLSLLPSRVCPPFCPNSWLYLKDFFAKVGHQIFQNRYAPTCNEFRWTMQQIIKNGIGSVMPSQKAKFWEISLNCLDTSIFLSSTACYISGIVRINMTVKLASISTLLIVDQNRCFQFFVNMFQRLMHRGVLLSRWWILHVYNLTGQLRSVGQMLLILTGWEYDTCQPFMLNIVLQKWDSFLGL